MSAMPGSTAKRPSVTLTDVHSAPGHLLRRAHQIAVAIFLDEFKDDITPIQYATLVAIADKPGIDQQTLAKSVAIDRSTIAVLLNRMENQRLIVRRRPKRDRRMKELFITEAGKGLLGVPHSLLDRVGERILMPLSPIERRHFIELLLRVVNANNHLSRAPLATFGETGSVR
jgi:DNA-binding MarR family transcriptional regulator